MIVGGGTAYTFLKLRGMDFGTSLYDEAELCVLFLKLCVRQPWFYVQFPELCVHFLMSCVRQPELCVQSLADAVDALHRGDDARAAAHVHDGRDVLFTAGPQTRVPDGMFLATWSVLVQLIMTIIVPICTGSAKPERNESGRVKALEGAHFEDERLR